MNREHWKAMAPLLAAYGEGKDLQFQMGECVSWGDFDGGYPSPSNASIRWRIKPTPRLRPWRPEEVPVGAVVRSKHPAIIERGMIVGVDSCGIQVGVKGKDIKFEYALKEWELLDGSPCGVSEEVSE